jgi:hypothetical protein
LRRVFEGVVAKCIAGRDLLADEGFSSMRCLIKAAVHKKEAGAWRSADCLAEGRGGIPCARPIARKER